MGLRLSIIVPIYNVEPYLRRCVDSLLSQDLPEEEYEIILVDDGSPDNCGVIADDYAASHKNVRVAHQNNLGISEARNTGIGMAHGEYIQFVDSDDYLEPDVLGTLVAKMDEDQLDVLRFNYQNVNEQYEVFEPYKDSKPFVDYCDKICTGSSFLAERLGYACYTVQFMMRHSLFEQSDLRFKPGIYFEDTEWTPRMLQMAKRVTSIDTMVYNYLLHDGSITHCQDEKKNKVLNDKLLLIDSLQSQCRELSDKRWYEGMISVTAFSVLTMASQAFYPNHREYVKELRRRHVFPLSLFHCTTRVARKYRMVNICPPLFCVLYHLKNR